MTIVNPNGLPVAGATVNGHWENATTDIDSGTTNTSGKVTLSSNTLRRPPSGTTFTFVVDSVAKSGWIYDPAANAETRDSVVVP